MARPQFEQRVRDREDARIIRLMQANAKAAKQEKTKEKR